MLSAPPDVKLLNLAVPVPVLPAVLEAKLEKIQRLTLEEALEQALLRTRGEALQWMLEEVPGGILQWILEVVQEATVVVLRIPLVASAKQRIQSALIRTRAFVLPVALAKRVLMQDQQLWLPQGGKNLTALDASRKTATGIPRGAYLWKPIAVGKAFWTNLRHKAYLFGTPIEWSKVVCCV
jgi:hypothetical protein